MREPGRRIRLDDGSQITITNAHKLHGPDGWTLDVKVGGFVCVPGRIRWDGDPLAHDLVEVVAWQLAEGYETAYVPGPGARARKRSDSARITQRDEAVLRRLRRLVGDVAATEHLEVGAMPITRQADRAATLCINSRDWRRYLERKLGYRWGARSADKQVPPRIMAADDRSVAVFLRAFFDAEGHVAGHDRGVLEITSASRALITEVQLLLRRFGIWLRIKPKRKAATNGTGIMRTYWTGYLGGPSLRRYARDIGFDDAGKRDRLGRACAMVANANVETVPVADMLAELRAAGLPGRWLLPVGIESYRGVGMSRGLVLQCCAAIRAAHDRAMRRSPDRSLSPAAVAAAQRVAPEQLERAAELLERRAEREVFYAKVVEVENVVLDEWVYDLCVAEHHNYVAGGMLAHNTISTGRAIAHRATATRRFRALVVAEGRLLGQWRDELTHGAPGRGLPPLAPNADVHVLSEHRSIAAQLRALDRELGDRPGVVLAPNGVLDRYPADLQAIAWHLLVADEALRYVNPATEAHQALAQVRFACVADCWLLTATPRGKSSEHLDVLVSPDGSGGMSPAAMRGIETSKRILRATTSAVTRWDDLGPEDKVHLDLTYEQRELLESGLSAWAGPSSATNALAYALGYADRAMLHREMPRIGDEIALQLPLSRRDWARARVALEVVWSSYYWGAAHDWQITSSWDDERTLRALRELQRTHFRGLGALREGVDILDDRSEPAPPGHKATVVWSNGDTEVLSAAELMSVLGQVTLASLQHGTRTPVAITIEGGGTLTSFNGEPPVELTYAPEGEHARPLPLPRRLTYAAIRYFFATGTLPGVTEAQAR